MTKQALILSGGAGTRLRSLVDDRPKPMVEVCGRPFLEWLIINLREQGINRIILATHYMSGYIKEYFGEGACLDVSILYSVEQVPLGTAGAIRFALDLIDTPDILVLNGDSYCRWDLVTFTQQHISCGTPATLGLIRHPKPTRYGTVQIENNCFIHEFQEKGHCDRPAYINGGIYLLQRSLIAAMPQAHSLSLERDVFPSLVKTGLSYHLLECPFLDIGVPEDYLRADDVLQKEFSKLANVEV